MHSLYTVWPMRLLRGKATDGTLLAPLTFAIAALAVGFVPHTWHFPPWITLLTLVCAAFRLLAEHRRWHLPPIWVRALLALAALFGVLALYASINGIVPGTALLALMAALKLLETHRRRDLFVVLFIALFLILASLLREQAIWSLPYLAVALLTCLIAWQQVARFGRPLPVRTALSTAFRIGAQAAPLLIAFWILFPRVPGPFWAVPSAAGSATTGISDRIEPGSIASLIRSDAVAFRVEFKDALPASRDMYWRGPVMESVVGRAWQVSDFPPMGRDDGPIRYAGEPYRYRMTLQATGQRWLFALDVPETWDHRRARMTPTFQLTVPKPIDERTVVELASYTRFSIGTSMSAGLKQRLAFLPNELNPRTHALARELFDEAGGVDAYINAVLRRFADGGYSYTLEPPALGLNAVDEFLFQTRAGFCEHYASAFATLMRAAGIPARLVAGYHGGEMNPLGGYWIVRQSDAHAWVEVWQDGTGWQRVDPTAAVADIRLESGLDAALAATGQAGLGGWLDLDWLSGAGFTWDAVNARWDEWVLGYGPATQRRFMQWLGMDDPRWQKLAMALGLATLLALALVAWRLARRYAKKPLDAAEKTYRRVLARAGVKLEPFETASVAAATFRQRYPALSERATAFFAVYQAIRFAGLDDNGELGRRATELIRALRQEPAPAATHR